jgi:tetratricopeptide (TPR) repeat protein
MSVKKLLVDRCKALLKSGSIAEAILEVQSGLEKSPYQIDFLIIANDIYRASGDYDKSLKYAELIIANYPDNNNGYIRAAEDLTTLRRLDEANSRLKKIANKGNLLFMANDVYRSSGDHERALKYAELIITKYPDNESGYIRSAEDLIHLKRFTEAQKRIQSGLNNLPNQLNLLIIANHAYRASGDHEKSLAYAKHLISHHPGNENGYIRAAEDLIYLKSITEAQKYVQLGLEKFPNNINLLTIANNLCQRSRDNDRSFEYSQKLHDHGSDLTAKIFNEILIYALKRCNTNGATGNRDKAAAVDYYFNSRFVLSREKLPFNFIYIPKNACSSIKVSLLKHLTNLSAHEIKKDPHKAAEEELKRRICPDKDFIYLVRNPYTRFISAFTDKCRPDGDKNVWPRMCERYGFDPKSKISMDTLLDALLSDESNLIDEHFRPQNKITCASFIKPSRVFFMEEISLFKSFLQSHGIYFAKHAPHATHEKAQSIDELNKKLISKIYRLYAEDFSLYGYSENPDKKTAKYTNSATSCSSNFLEFATSIPPDLNTKERDSLLFESPPLGKKSSLSALIKNTKR